MNDRRVIIDGNIIDNRDLAASKITKIKDYREQVNYTILVTEGIDELTQINAAIGIYDEERTEEIKSIISLWRDRFIAAKASILAAASLSELDLIKL